MTNKYEMLKDYVNELGKIKNDDTIKDIKDLMKQLDNAAPDEQQDGEMLTADEWNALSYKERIELKETKPELFNNAMAHKFKGAK